MKVELTIVGVRNYCGGGEDGYPELFARLPIGTEVYLRKNPTGTPFPGSVSVFDDAMHQIGTMGKTERLFIELEIPEGGMLPVTISGHSAEDNCMYFTAENTKGFKEPYIRQTSAEEGEIIFATTEHDQRLSQLTDMMLMQVKRPEPNVAAICRLAKEYAQYCCTSLDGDTSFARGEILVRLKALSNEHEELKTVWREIFELHKDLGRKQNDMKVKVYKEQFERIKREAECGVTKRDISQLETYKTTLAFQHGDHLDKKVIEAEIQHLSELLSKELMGNYVQHIETDEDFATALYSLNYSMRAMYVLYTRRIKLAYMKQLLETDQRTTPKKKTKPVERERMVFSMGNGVTVEKLSRLYVKLVTDGWIGGSGADFRDFFHGKKCDVWLTWENKYGKSTLVYLFKQLIEAKVVALPPGYTLSNVLEGHFKDKEGKWLIGLDKGDPPAQKAVPFVAECVATLKYNRDEIEDADEFRPEYGEGIDYQEFSKMSVTDKP